MMRPELLDIFSFGSDDQKTAFMDRYLILCQPELRVNLTRMYLRSFPDGCKALLNHLSFFVNKKSMDAFSYTIKSNQHKETFKDLLKESVNNPSFFGLASKFKFIEKPSMAKNKY